MITQPIINHYMIVGLGERSLTYEYIADNLWRPAMTDNVTTGEPS